MTAQQQEKVNLVAGFIDTKAPEFHRAFGTPSKLNRSTMHYESAEVSDLRETLECHQKARKYVDFTDDLTTCTWEDVHAQLHRAQDAAVESKRRGNNPLRKAWRAMGATSSILEPGLEALPDELCILHGGLAMIFSLARHSEMNRLKILDSFEMVPNIIETARNKAKNFPFDSSNQKSVQLHRNVESLQTTLIRTLPVLINKLVPGSFKNALKSTFGTWEIDRLLQAVHKQAEKVRVSAESIIEEMIAGNYSASKSMQQQLDEVLEKQSALQLSLDAAQSTTHLMEFLLGQLNFQAMGAFPSREPTEPSEIGTAFLGYTPEDLLKIIDVNHLRTSSDTVTVMRRAHTFTPADIEQAAYMIIAPQVKVLLTNPGPNVVAINGHFDRTQMGKISPLSYVCAMLSQALRRQSHQHAAFPVSPQSEKGSPGSIVLEYFCALHTEDDDDLHGPQGLMRCLTTQLVFSLLANEWISPTDPLSLPHLCDGEEELLAQYNVAAVCRLFTVLVRRVPRSVSIYCLVDSWSAYEYKEQWQTDYDDVLRGFHEAANASNPNGGASFKLLLTSPGICRNLGDFVMPGQRVSLRNRGVGGRGTGRGSIMGLVRAATMPDVGFPDQEPEEPWADDGIDRRSSR